MKEQLINKIFQGDALSVLLKQNKNFVGIELNKEYIDICNKRLKPYLEQTRLGEY